MRRKNGLGGWPGMRTSEKNVCHECYPTDEGGKQCCMEDEVWPLGIGLQGQVPNHLELLWSRARVVSVEEKARHERVRYGPRRRT